MARILVVLLMVTAFGFSLRAQENTVADVTAVAETQPSPGDGPTSPLIWLHPDDHAQSLIIGTDDNSGIGVYDLNGNLLSFEEAYGGLGIADLRYHTLGFDSLIAAAVKDEARVVFFTIDAASSGLIAVGSLETGIRLQGACLYISPLTANTYVFAFSEFGKFEQYRIIEDDGELSASLERAADVGGEVEGCTVDDALRRLYFSEGENAVWRYGAEPEDGIQRRIVEISGDRIEEEIEGLAIYSTSSSAGYLLVSNQNADSVLLYERTGDNRFVGEFQIRASETVDSVSEPSNFAVTGLPLDERFPQGLLITSDDVNTNPNGNSNFKLVSWALVAEGLDLDVDMTFNPRILDAVNTSDISSVTALVETIPVPSATDAADDPAIWVHPTDRNLSLIIGTDKTSGLVTYNLDGSIQQTLNIGRLNNVDVRDGFLLNRVPVSLVTATNRTDSSLEIYRVDVESRLLVDVAARQIVSDVEEVYGICMYISSVSGQYYVFINSADTGEVEQYALQALDGKVDAQVVRRFIVGTQTEGCAVDDETGALYIGEEAVGLWRYAAEPDAGEERVLIDHTGEGGNLTADVEGVAIYAGADGAGYLLVSSQGSSSFAVYDRQGENVYLGSFRVLQTETIDAVSGTDGLDVSSYALGEAFPDGVIVVQDDLNINPSSTQNFKLISWRDLAEAMNLTITPR